MAESGEDFDSPILMEEETLITKKKPKIQLGENQKNSELCKKKN